MADIDLSSHEPPVAAADRCFLCGDLCAPDQLTREHVFPKWLQRMVGLFDQQLHLLNGTVIPYRSLTIPACAVCNGIALSRIEDRLVRAMPGGADAVRSLGHELLYVWLAKLFFGTLYAEGLLPMDRRAPEQGPIASPDLLAAFDHMHYLMQGARTKMVFIGEETAFHSSILIFAVQQHPNPTARFMYRDDVQHACIALRLDRVGFICVVDGGAQERMAKEVMPAVLSHHLHPLQFEEVCAKVFMKARTMTRTPKYMNVFGPLETQLIQMPMAGISDRPMFEDWDQEEYGRLLALFTQFPLDTVSPGNGKVMTWLEDLDAPRFVDVNQVPWP